MTAVHKEAARLTDDFIGTIRERQLEIARQAIEEGTGEAFEGPEEVKQDLHLLHDLDEIPHAYRELGTLRDRLDAAYYALLGEDLAGDEEQFSTDPTPGEETARRYRDRLEEIDADAVVARKQDAIDRLEDAIDALLG